MKIGSYSVDGICGSTVYKFLGCYWHACPKCMKRPNQLTVDNYTSAKEAYELTLARKNYLVSQNYEVIEMWECELTCQLAENETMRIFFNKIEIMEPIEPRDAFYEGRTKAVKLYHKVRMCK